MAGLNVESPKLQAHLVRKAAVLVARLQQLAPHGVEALVVLRQQRPVLLPHLRHHLC